jgi:hypothetical protein
MPSGMARIMPPMLPLTAPLASWVVMVVCAPAASDEPEDRRRSDDREKCPFERAYLRKNA